MYLAVFRADMTIKSTMITPSSRMFEQHEKSGHCALSLFNNMQMRDKPKYN
jgi:hypothetical protein